MRPLDLDTAERILNFSGGNPKLEELHSVQIKGAVALHNMIANPEVGIGYAADEVGMGKTYVALGVIALLRYFNPSLKVLYICPSRNVQEKWYLKEFPTFVRNVVKVSHYRVRTLHGRSASPRINCNNMPELLNAASSGYWADVFVRMSVFSLPLTNDETQWQAKLQALQRIVPAVDISGQDISKQSVKDQYAVTLNRVLPTFDLVVIDEAHNFKHDFESSDRNRVLSAILGFREGSPYQRVKHALLLSATPYDRNIEQLRNQLRLVGHERLLPADVSDSDPTEIEGCVRRFMVRRLNVLSVAGKRHTRNMYRKEWRREEGQSGTGRYGDGLARITLETDEQKLITALVQKKVGEVLGKQGGNPAFQIGLLASFESFAETTRSGPVEFDGDVNERDRGDAADGHVIGAIRESYIGAGLGRTLPHPKMDIVTNALSEQLFERGRKQIVFVRRVKSVKELKDKLDDGYTEWIEKQISRSLEDYRDQALVMRDVVKEYRRLSRRRDGASLNDEFREGKAGDAEETEDRQDPKNDNLFTWFFRGECPPEAQRVLDRNGRKYPTPDAMRTGLTSKNQSVAPLFEINWARALYGALDVKSGFDDRALEDLLHEHGDWIADRTSRYRFGDGRRDLFEAAQSAFLDWYGEYKCAHALVIRKYLQPRERAGRSVALSKEELSDALCVRTLFCALRSAGLGEQLLPLLESNLQKLAAGTDITNECLNKSLKDLEIHRNLMSLCLRTGHGVVDLYLARIKLGPGDLDKRKRSLWMTGLAEDLKRQRDRQTLEGVRQFSTFGELHSLACHLGLIVRNNFPDVRDRDRRELRLYLARSLNPLAPIIGATGETATSRSAQARRFRMPGYPLGLISTDVFQEGEDLHTFCDSVVHYGLAGTPIGIEQKNGRVDRVNSLVQRRLDGVQVGCSVSDRDLIQVSYPFVSESIERLQVRMLCRNLNQFIRSLDKIGNQQAGTSDKTYVDKELVDRSEIEGQIQTLLESRYEPKVHKRSPDLNREPYIGEQESHINGAIEHLKSLVERHFARKASKSREERISTWSALETVDNGRGLMWKCRFRSRSRQARATTQNDAQHKDYVCREMRISIRSARADRELLLAAEFEDDEEISLDGMCRHDLQQLMQRKSWHVFHRTYAKRTATRQYLLCHDSELLVGDEHSTSMVEVERFFQRFEHAHDPTLCGKPETEKTRAYWAEAKKNGSRDPGNMRIRVTGLECEDCLELNFRFGLDALSRMHRVRIVEAEGRCIFLSRVASSEVVRSLSVEQLVKLTWERNRNLDVVEFMLDDDFCIVGRAVHPVEGMDYREFWYCARTLAESSDHLEFLIREEDIN